MQEGLGWEQQKRSSLDLAQKDAISSRDSHSQADSRPDLDGDNNDDRGDDGDRHQEDEGLRRSRAPQPQHPYDAYDLRASLHPPSPSSTDGAEYFGTNNDLQPHDKGAAVEVKDRGGRIPLLRDVANEYKATEEGKTDPESRDVGIEVMGLAPTPHGSVVGP